MDSNFIWDGDTAYELPSPKATSRKFEYGMQIYNDGTEIAFHNGEVSDYQDIPAVRFASGRKQHWSDGVQTGGMRNVPRGQ